MNRSIETASKPIDCAERIVLQGERIAPHAVEWLARARGGRIHSLFQHAINLIDKQGELFSLILPPLGPGPFALLLQPAPMEGLLADGFVGVLELGAPIRSWPGALQVGALEVRLRDLQIWDPRPNWDGLRGSLTPARVEQLGQLLRHHAPPGSLAPLADRPARSLWSERASGGNLSAALLFTIAGLARELLSGLIRSERGEIQRAASKLAGLGGGVTPAGDDFVLGAIHALWASADRNRATELARAMVDAVGSRTNAVSLAWLRAAARGEAANEWHALFEAVLAGRPIDQVTRHLIRRGHTSGADALAGFVLARRALVSSAEAGLLVGLPS